MEENIDVVPELLKILKKNFRANQMSTKSFVFISPVYPMLLKLDVVGNNFKLMGINIRQNTNAGSIYSNFPKYYSRETYY